MKRTYPTPPVNEFQSELRRLSDPPNYAQAIAFAERMISQAGYDAVRRDPGMVAWIMEHEDDMAKIARAKRSMFKTSG